MAKTKLYYKNGIPYYKSGGRFYPLPKAQGGLSSLDSGGQGPNLNLISTVGNLGATGLGMIGDMVNPRKQDYNPSAGVTNIMAGYGNDGLESGVGTLLNTASSLDPTGTSAAISAALNIGKGLGNILRREDEHGIANNEGVLGKLMTSYGNALDPIGNIQRSINVGKKHGFKEGLKNFVTLGNSGTDLMEEDLKRAETRDANKRSNETLGLNVGNYRNDSIYAKKGVNLQSVPTSTNKKYNVEIEDGEILLGNPGTTKKSPGSTTSLGSKFAVKFHGDKHGEDTDGDGLEGIPLNTDNGYIASNYLGLDGKPVKKQKGGKSGKTVADEMTPLVEYLHKAEQNSQDGYISNPVAIKEVLRQLEGMKSTAEVNKARQEIAKLLKDTNIPFEEVLMSLQELMPVEDLNQEESEAYNQVLSKFAEAEGQQQQMAQQNQPSPEEMLMMMNQQAEQLPQAPMAKKGLNMYKRYQQGGPMPEQGGPEQNMSHEHMMQLMQQAQQQVNPQQQEGMMVPGLEDLDPQVQEMFAQLPPEVQEEISQLPPEQMEIAIINAIKQLEQEQAQGPQMDPAMMEQMMMEQGGGEEGEMDPAMMEAMMAEQQALMKMGGSINEYFGDKFRDANSVNYSPSQSPKTANAHLPRPIQLEGHFNPKTKTHMKQMGAFQDNYQDGGYLQKSQVGKEVAANQQVGKTGMEQKLIDLYKDRTSPVGVTYWDRGEKKTFTVNPHLNTPEYQEFMSKHRAIQPTEEEKKLREWQRDNERVIKETKDWTDKFAYEQYRQNRQDEYNFQKDKYNRMQKDYADLKNTFGQEKAMQMMKERYADEYSKVNKPVNNDMQIKQTGGAISSEMVNLVEQLMNEGYSPEQAVQIAQRKLAQQAPEMKNGGMIGKTVSFKMGGKVIKGKIKSIDANGNFTIE